MIDDLQTTFSTLRMQIGPANDDISQERLKRLLAYVEQDPDVPPIEAYVKRAISPKFRAEMVKHAERCDGEVDLMKGGPYTRTTWVHRRSADILRKLVTFLDKD
ncbi:hypothetical protein HOT99_gp137 [Caulobacter phage CcrBL10]|uniref:Uncharacterized protein n=1 Tax=Caulobacter phage CcrBL10 TaxID=2283269 RepID=A0A385E9W7_9CAUD|nr:hypothetical protein HOT99_gp137 [Caulobacter phage CcrBL10]AXQ68480.1 hypothetical protein CcrBL10_gp276 [Caulobacter phage CcrBL10]